MMNPRQNIAVSLHEMPMKRSRGKLLRTKKAMCRQDGKQVRMSPQLFKIPVLQGITQHTMVGQSSVKFQLHAQCCLVQDMGDQQGELHACTNHTQLFQAHALMLKSGSSGGWTAYTTCEGHDLLNQMRSPLLGLLPKGSMVVLEVCRDVLQSGEGFSTLLTLETEFQGIGRFLDCSKDGSIFQGIGPA